MPAAAARRAPQTTGARSFVTTALWRPIMLRASLLLLVLPVVAGAVPSIFEPVPG